MQLMLTGNAATKDRKNQLYETPAVAVRALLAYEKVDDVVWEPACGPGAIVKVLRETGRTVIATDLKPYGLEDSQSQIDFLKQKNAPGGCKAIVTNPPFELADKFVEKALELCPHVYMLLRVGFLAGTRWEIRNNFGDHLARVRIFTPRLPFMHRVGFEGIKLDMSSAIDFAWYCFARNHIDVGEASVSWLRWKEHLTEAEEATILTRKVKAVEQDEDRQTSIFDVIGETQVESAQGPGPATGGETVHPGVA
jgi:hypothetical protein